MESSRTHDECLALYRTRLENLSTIMSELYQVVKNDEIVSSLTGDAMEKYRIARINEIVNDVLISEKEVLLIRALEKCAELTTQLQHTKTSKSDSYFEGLIQLKEKNHNEMAGLNLIIEEKVRIISELTKINAELVQQLNIASSQPENNCQNCEKLTSMLNSSKNELSMSRQLVEKLKTDGQVAVKSLLEKLESLREKNLILEQQKDKQKEKEKEKPWLRRIDTSEESKLKNEEAKRNERMQKMKRQIMRMEDELMEVQRQFQCMKEISMGTICNEVKKMRSEQAMLRDCVGKYREKVGREIQNVAKQFSHKIEMMSYKREVSLKPDKLLSKLNCIENEIDYFLENEVLAD